MAILTTTEKNQKICPDKRKNLIKTLLAIAVAAALSLCAVTADAVVYYSYAGYDFWLDGDNANLHSYSGTDRELYIPDKIRSFPVTGIDDCAFFERGDFQELYLQYASNLKAIGSFAFCRCTGIHYAEIPSRAEAIGSGAFQECTSLESVVYKNRRITEIDSQTFYACSSLREVTLPPSLTKIGDYAFAECTSLEYLELTKSVTAIGEGAFLNDGALTLGAWFDSYARVYAEQNGVSCVLLDDVMLGDANGDGYININDVTVIQRHLAQLAHLDGIYLYAAETDHSGELGISDATALQMFLAEYDTPYHIGEAIRI